MRCFMAGVLTLFVGGCADETLGLVVTFVNEESFLLAESARVHVIEARDCAEAFEEVTTEASPAIRLTERATVCDLRAGVVLAPLPRGAHAYVVRVFHPQAGSEPILMGCRLADGAAEAPGELEVFLDLTPSYLDYRDRVLAAGGPACQSIEDKCDGACVR